MAKVEYAVFLAITLALGSSYAAANFTIPFLTPSFGDEACKTNVCGKGSCVPTSSSTFGFECQCQQGWKQSRPDDDQFFKFLPCVVPNCTVDFNCARAPAPAPNHQNSNYSAFDPCFWTDCGGGSCNKASVFTHSCVCEEGYYNLFNSTSFPCYKECAIEGDCAKLGISMMNSSNPSPPRSTSVVGDSESHASSMLAGVELGWLITIIATLAQLLLNYS